MAVKTKKRSISVKRKRGEGPTCPECGSGMVANGVAPTNHPFRQPRVRYWRCMNPDCRQTLKR